MASAVLAPAAAGLAARTGRLSGRSLAAKPTRALQQIRGLRPVVAMAQKTEKKGKEQEVFLGVKGNAQLLGMKGADMETDIWKIRVQLMKPVTWIPLIWGVLCGAAASGAFTWTPENVAKSLLCMVMSGPLLTGYTQTINDWYDREIDAINEPYRPIPSGRISEGEVIAQIWILLLGGIGVAAVLDLWAGHDFPIMTLLAIFGSFISYIYSAPPLKLKQSGWAGNYALGSSYIALPWWAGQALFGTLSLDVMVLTILYSIAGLGIAIVNDFKSIEGDRAMGLQSLPVAFGVDTAKWICVASIDATQLGVAAYLAFGLNEPIYGAVLLGLILPQIYAQVKYFLPDPVANDVKYQASAQPFLVFGLLTTGLAVGAHNSGAAAAKAAEITDAISSRPKPGTMDLVLLRRKGFVRIALEAGADLVPVLAFGENEQYHRPRLRPGGWLDRFQTATKRGLGFTLPLCYGRTFLGLGWSPLPEPVPIVVVVGAPIRLPAFKGDLRSEQGRAAVDACHARYCEALQALYDAHKDALAAGRRRDMRFVA